MGAGIMILATLVGIHVEYIQLISKRYPLEDGAGISSVRLTISIFVAFSVLLWRREWTGCGESKSVFDAFCISFGLGKFGYPGLLIRRNRLYQAFGF